MKPIKIWLAIGLLAVASAWIGYSLHQPAVGRYQVQPMLNGAGYLITDTATGKTDLLIIHASKDTNSWGDETAAASIKKSILPLISAQQTAPAPSR